jgi:diguanylate cyclase (GGDEF)-like protein
MEAQPQYPLKEAMGMTDSLTGLPNGRAWDEGLRKELARAKRGAHDVSIALVDLDDFDAYQHAHGGLAAEVLLCDAAHAWRLALRVYDLIARVGTGGFAVLLTECGGYALQPVERLRAATPGSQTCSAGFAIWNWLETAETLTARANAALREAKQQGGDCAVLAQY